MALRRFIYLVVAVLAMGAIWFLMAAQRSPKLRSSYNEPDFSSANTVTPSDLTSPKLQSYFNVPGFKLTERSGKTVTLSDLAGKVWVANFFYASCPGPCPVINGKISALQDKVLKNDGVFFVSITTQPDTDTPAVLRQYADRFHASGRWLFLTGDKAQIFNLSNNGFKLGVTEDSDPAQPITHSTKLALVDKSGVIRGYYDGMDDEALRKLEGDIKKLLRE